MPEAASSSCTTRSSASSSDEAKFELLVPFGHALPALRRRLVVDLRRRGLPQERVLALVVTLLEDTFVRIGNEEYARTNGSFGLTTLRDRHVRYDGSGVRLRFPGKSGKGHDVAIGDPRLARLVRKCQDLPGQVLFQYLGEDDVPRPGAVVGGQRLPARHHRHGGHGQDVPDVVRDRARGGRPGRRCPRRRRCGRGEGS